MDRYSGLLWLLVLKIINIQGVSSDIKINKSKNFNINGILETTGSIIQNCFSQYSQITFISDAWNKEDHVILSRTFSLFHPLKLINLQDNKTFEVSNTNLFLSPYTDRNYVIVISSKNNLLIALQKLRNSKVWDHGGFFLVVYKNVREGCQTKEELLEIVWSFNILSNVLVCGDLNNQIYLYTFNPYTNLAPTFWTVIESRYPRNNRLWILKHKLQKPLIRKCFTINHYKPNQISNNNFIKLCFINKARATLLKDLDFDKANNLGGRIIKIGVGNSTNPKYNITKTGADRYLGKAGSMFRLIWNHLNGAYELSYYSSLCLKNKMDQECPIFKDLSAGKIDYIINPIFIHSFWKYHTFPKETLGLCALAAMNKKTVSEKFLSTFTTSFWVIMISTTLFIIIFLKYLLNCSLVTCLLETLRMFLYMSTHRQPQQAFKQSLFVMLLFLTMTLNWNFQSRLSAMFVAPDLHPYIDSLQDLENFHLPVYGKKDFGEYFFSTHVFHHYTSIDQLEDCIAQLESGKLVACIFPCSEKCTVRQSERVHIAKNPVKELFITTYVRSDWPLFLKISDLIQKLYEAGFIQLFERRDEEFFNRVEDANEEFVKLSISNLYISCLILVFGSIIATCVLIMEVICHNRSNF